MPKNLVQMYSLYNVGKFNYVLFLFIFITLLFHSVNQHNFGIFLKIPVP